MKKKEMKINKAKRMKKGEKRSMKNGEWLRRRGINERQRTQLGSWKKEEREYCPWNENNVTS